MRNLEQIHQAQNVETTEEYQQKFVGKVDPFAENKKKKTIKAKKIKFVAKGPEEAAQWGGEVKHANLPEAKVHVVGSQQEADELEEESLPESQSTGYVERGPQ